LKRATPARASGRGDARPPRRGGDARTSSHATPPLPGRVVKLFVAFGDSVTEGQPLLALDSPDLAAAQSEYLRAKGAVNQAQRTAARQKDLADHGIGAQREVEQAQTELAAARSELDRAALRLKVLGIGPSMLGKPLVVRSPIGGRVTELSVAPGEFRNDPNAVLLVVADLSTVWVTANVQEKDIRRVHKGDAASATFPAYPGEKFDGHVLAVGDLLDPDTRTIKVRIAFANPEAKLRPGMFATVTFTSAPINEVVVPSKALVLIGDKSFVFVEKSPFSYERRPVEPGEQQGDRTVIARGLGSGERLVVENAVLLQ
jgi:membrane fusion protein, heavy metal efflux system